MKTRRLLLDGRTLPPKNQRKGIGVCVYGKSAQTCKIRGWLSFVVYYLWKVRLLLERHPSGKTTKQHQRFVYASFIAVKFVTSSNVYNSNGMTAFWQWVFDIAKSYIICQKVAALVIAGNYVAMSEHLCHSVAMKLLALVITGNYVAMWTHLCHSVTMKLLALVIASNYVAM